MKHGFTLLELAIVLAIIGLIAGGIVAGSSMIRAAELRTLITELTQIRTSIAAFQTKYTELPGDMTNATRLWGSAPCPIGTSTGTATCDGDGNGIISIAKIIYNFLVLTLRVQRHQRYRFLVQMKHIKLTKSLMMQNLLLERL